MFVVYSLTFYDRVTKEDIFVILSDVLKTKPIIVSKPLERCGEAVPRCDDRNVPLVHKLKKTDPRHLLIEFVVRDSALGREHAHLVGG